MRILILFMALLYAGISSAQVPSGRRAEKEKAKANRTRTTLEAEVAVYVGQVQAAEAIKQLAPFAGTTVRQIASPGSEVKRGQSILVLSQKTLGEAYADFTAKANLAGILNEYHVAPGEEFSANAPLFTILDTTSHRIKLAISYKDHAHIDVKDKVQITFDDQQMAQTGHIYRKSLVPINGTGLFAVEIEVPKDVPIGTFAQVAFQRRKDAVSQNQDKTPGAASTGEP